MISTLTSSAFRSELLRWSSTERLSLREHPSVRGADGRPLLLVGPSADAPPKLALHALATPCAAEDVLPADATAALACSWQDDADGDGAALPLVHLWEDQWRFQRPIVSSRLLAMNGRSRRIFARKTSVRRIDAATLERFLREHHLWGPTQARFRYGLFVQGGAGDDDDDDGEQPVAVASFSPRRHVMRGGERYRSHELIRYCSRRGVSVVGGISKLLSAFVTEMTPDDVVTVVDRDWGEPRRAEQPPSPSPSPTSHPTPPLLDLQSSQMPPHLLPPRRSRVRASHACLHDDDRRRERLGDARL